MKLYAEISKVEDQDDGTIKVWGYASSEAVDSDGEIITSDAMKAALPDYMKFGAVREMHQPKAAGTAIEATVEDDGRTYFGAHVVDSEAVKKVKASVYKGFSIGGKVTERDETNKAVIKGLKLVEISLVDRPANPEAVFTCYKAETVDAPAPEKVAAIDALGDMLNKGEITPERLLELAKSETKPTEHGTEGAKTGTEAAPAETKTAAESGDIKKGMYDVSSFAQLLNSLGYIASDAEWEAQYEGDASPIPQALRDWLAQGIGIFQAMAAEETAEMMARLQAMVPAQTIVEVIEAGDKTGDLAKSGARFSKETKAALGAAHEAMKTACDHMDKLGYKDDDDDDAGKAATGDDLAKLSSELDTVKADLAKVSDERDTLKKRITELEKMPAPGKALLKAIDKGQDVGQTVQKTDDPVPDNATPEQKAMAEIRKMYRTGGTALAR